MPFPVPLAHEHGFERIGQVELSIYPQAAGNLPDHLNVEARPWVVGFMPGIRSPIRVGESHERAGRMNPVERLAREEIRHLDELPNCEKDQTESQSAKVGHSLPLS